MIAVELRDAAKAIPRSPDDRAGDPYDELTLEDIRLMAADADEMWLIHSLEACMDPEAPAWKHLSREEALRRARAFAR